MSSLIHIGKGEYVTPDANGVAYLEGLAANIRGSLNGGEPLTVNCGDPPPVVNAVEPLPDPTWPGPVANAQDFPIVERSDGGLPEFNWDTYYSQPRRSDVKQPATPKPLAANTPAPMGDVQPLPDPEFGW